ncbi:ABC transporter ATP-binding protein [Marivirga sp. S37H4]|uniref:ABC transporter ATP-binding protein n=1 Tax=Marivirga aurantiaca TaxID=2802615 RepID=A0A935C888_9BACT|nr:ABC transporter ATP-binding protein [Marivirga aurantiaca]MBK6265329.1 ABC transporter ATP-binding protein [Marivirga aurantiaca]
MLTAKNIYKSYDDLQVLSGVDFSVNAAKLSAIVGPSGAGKSTLLHILGTLDQSDSGTLIINNKNIGDFRGDELANFRNNTIGFIFQFHNLLPEFTAEENICIPAYIAKKNKREIGKRVEELLKVLGLSNRASHKPAQLSGGEQQRVAVARALMNDPAIVFADEPSGNLDSKNADELHHLFLNLRDELGQAFVIVTHNQELSAMADERHEMKDGKLIKL